MAEGSVEFQEKGKCDEFKKPTCQTHKETLESYCRSHNIPICGSCKLMTHRTCKLQDLERVSRGSTRKILGPLLELRAAKTHMKEIGNSVGNMMETLEAQKTNAIDTIKRKMEELKVLGQKEIAEVEKTFQQERDKLAIKASDVQKSTKLIEKSIKEVERATNVGSEEEIFVAAKQAESDVAKFHNIVWESSQLPHTNMYFEVDDRLTNITSFGKMCVEKATLSVDFTPVVTDVINYSQFDRKIVWFTILPNEKMLLLCTSQLSLYNANKKFLFQLNLPGAISADMLNDYQVIVALPDTQQLQIVNIDTDRLIRDSFFKMKVVPELLLKYSAHSVSVTVLVLARNRDRKVCLQIIDLLTSKMQNQVKLRTDLQIPVHMKMSHEKDAVYIVDSEKGCYGFNLKGGMIFHYSHEDYNSYDGLAADLRGNLYFSAGPGQGYKCVIKLSLAGQVLSQINIIKTYPMQYIGNKLYVSGLNDQHKWTLGYFYV